MTALPIVARELRVAARRPSVYRLRLVAGGLTLGLGAFFLLLGENLRVIAAGTAGRPLFWITSGLLVAAALAATLESCDCLSAEKREETIGLLFLTDLGVHDVVLGKLFAMALPGFYAMMAAIPLLAFSVLLGGVTGRELWRTSLALLNFFFFAQCAAMLASALSRRRERAAQMTSLLLALFILGSPLAAASLPGQVWIVRSLNPAYTLLLADGWVSTPAPAAFAFSLGAVHAAAWSFLALACLALPHLWRSKPLHLSEAAVGRHHAGRLGESEPFGWLARRSMLNPRHAATRSVVVVAVSLMVVWRWSTSPLVAAAAIVIPGFWLKYAVAASAGQSMEEHRRSGSLEILLACTPLEGGDVLKGQWHALRAIFLGPFGALFLAETGAIFCVRSAGLKMLAFCTAVQLPLEIVTAGWLAMWLAISQKKPGRAALNAFLLTAVAPAFLLGIPVSALSDPPAARFLMITAWAAIVTGYAVILLALSRANLRAHLRTLAANAGESWAALIFLRKPGGVPQA